MRPFFSTIIPTYNRAQLLEATLDSALAQEFDDHEVIVVDDGSTDDTQRLLARYGKRIQVFRQDQRGPGAARNLGIQQAQGRYVAFLDSDDLWFPWTLSTYHDVIQQHKEPSFVAGSAIRFRQKAEVPEAVRASPKTLSFSDYYASSEHSLWVGTCAAAVRSDRLREVCGFTQEWINAEDSDLWMRLGVFSGFVYISDPPVFAYREHTLSAVADFSRSYRGNRYLIEQEKAGRYPGGPERRRERFAILSRHVRPTSLQCLQHGEAAWGWDLYKACWRWNVRLGRVRYLVGFPWLFLLARARDWRMRHTTAGELARIEPVVKNSRR